MRSRPGWLVLTLLCSHVGCSEPPREPAEVSAGTADSVASPGSDLAGRPPLASESSAPQARPLLALDPEGLRLVDAQSGRARSIPFGSPASVAVESTSLALGSPAQRGSSPDCGMDYVSWEAGLTMSLLGDRFVGWFVRGESPSLTTMSGIGVGSTRSDLEGVYVARVAPSSLGVEFSAGGMAGVLSSTAPEGRITHLWAGEGCLAR